MKKMTKKMTTLMMKVCRRMSSLKNSWQRWKMMKLCLLCWKNCSWRQNCRKRTWLQLMRLRTFLPQMWLRLKGPTLWMRLHLRTLMRSHLTLWWRSAALQN